MNHIPFWPRKMKVFISWRELNSSRSLRVKSLNSKSLKLDHALLNEDLKFLKSITLSFWVAQKWVSYELGDFQILSEGDVVDELSFKLIKGESDHHFERHLQIAAV